jgi:hypothetical protein
MRRRLGLRQVIILIIRIKFTAPFGTGIWRGERLRRSSLYRRVCILQLLFPFSKCHQLLSGHTVGK